MGEYAWIIAIAIFFIWFWNSLFIIKEWERGAVLRLGRMRPEAKGAGLRIVLWPIETLYRIPLRLAAGLRRAAIGPPCCRRERARRG